jgi:hypothetical protein
MACGCKNNQLERAKRLLNGNTYEESDDVVQGQINGLFQQKFGVFPTEEEVIKWLTNGK